MKLDPLRVAAEAVAMMQHRRVLVGKARALIEVIACERAEPVEMRRDVRVQFVGEIELEQIGERRIGRKEIQPSGVGRDCVGARGRLDAVHTNLLPRYFARACLANSTSTCRNAVADGHPLRKGEPRGAVAGGQVRAVGIEPAMRQGPSSSPSSLVA